MQIGEIKREIQTVLDDDNGIMLYALVRSEEEFQLKFVNIADETSLEDNTSVELLNGFIEIVNAKFEVYDDESEILKLSSADERSNALYYYDLEQLPFEMQLLKAAVEAPGEIATFNFQQDSLNRIVAFIVVIGKGGAKLALFKKQYSVSLLKRDQYMLTPIPHMNRLAKVNQDILRMDFNYQFFLWNDVVYISDVEKMEKICSFHNIIINEAQKSISKINDMHILDNIEVLNDELDNISFARKLTRIYKDSKVLGKVSNQSIIDFSQRHSYFKSHPLKLTALKDKFILDTKRSKETFIKLMNDDFLTSELTKSDYESLAKNNV